MSDAAITTLTAVVAAVLAVALTGFLDGFWLRAVAAVLLGMTTAVVTQVLLRARRPCAPKPGVER